MKLARTLMVQGTASTVGKSTLVTGLCRVFAQAGWRVAPFKAQNMALNSFVTKSGGEMGRAQVVQAEAAGVEPTVEMNPVLLKPESNSRSQVIVMGRPLATLEAREYYRNRATLLGIVEEALTTLRSHYDLIIIEGAGSPVELNLARQDIVNMQIARLCDAPVLLVGDIDRGGIFASLLGTLHLLEPEDRQRVKGLIVNKFRGDISLWSDGSRLLASMGGVPVLGTVPMFNNIFIAEEDSVPLDEGTTTALRQDGLAGEAPLEIVVVRLPYLSNYDEFDPLFTAPGVRLRFAATPVEFPDHADLIILPGTKNTLSDLAWLWQRGLVGHIRQQAKSGSAVFGICGGYQMLGERLSDPSGAEAAAGTVEPGLALLPVETVFAPTNEKITLQSTVRLASSADYGLLHGLDDQSFKAYQIHLGRTELLSGSDTPGRVAFIAENSGPDGWLSETGWVGGCYLHGLFENDNFRQTLLATLAARRTLQPALPPTPGFSRQSEYDKLADLLRQHLDIPRLEEVCGLAE